MGKAFQPLFSTKVKGIGLGLSLAKMIIGKHGGTIKAKSELEKGATLIVCLPIYVKQSRKHDPDITSVLELSAKNCNPPAKMGSNYLKLMDSFTYCLVYTSVGFSDKIVVITSFTQFLPDSA